MIVPHPLGGALAIALAASLSSNAIQSSLPPVDGRRDATSPVPPSSSWLASASAAPSWSGLTPFRRYDTADDIPPSSFRSRETIRGRVVKVVDGDTVRIRHAPLHPLPFGETSCAGRRLSRCTISVRLYGVDAPETAKFGDPGQPCSGEATGYVSDRARGKIVSVKLLRRDRYSRVVGRVTAPGEYLPFLGLDLSEGLAEQGLAALYTGGGAEYDGRRGELEEKIRSAQEKRRGIWANGVEDFVDPAAYKREMKARKNGSQR